MEQHESGWLYDGQACDRLWNKSAIGRPIEGGKLLLTSADVIFCHDYRHLEWPSANWLRESVDDSPRLLDEAVVVESLRVPGNKLVMHQNFDALELTYADSTWGLRWASEAHPRSDDPVSEIRWYHASEHLDVEDLFTWSEQVSDRSRVPEVLVIDDEHAVVTYRVARIEPEGVMGGLSENDLEWMDKVIPVIVQAQGRSLGISEGEVIRRTQILISVFRILLSWRRGTK